MTTKGKFISLAMAQQMLPDNDYDTTVETLNANYQAGDNDAIWDLQPIEVWLIEPFQLIDDPADTEGHFKVEAIREASRAGTPMPPVFLIHHPENQHPFVLIEGRHRYNAAHREGADTIRAWLGHPSCDCAAGEPTAGDTPDSQPPDASGKVARPDTRMWR